MKFKKGEQYLEIVEDLDPIDPRDNDNLGKMICFHKHYKLGDRCDLKSEHFLDWEDLKEYIEGLNAVILPLYLLDHSGITMRTTPFEGLYGHWDSGQVGFIYITKKTMKENELNEKDAMQRLIEEIKVYDQYIRGDVYGYRLYTIKVCSMEYEHEVTTDSCWGFFGQDFKANGLFDSVGIESLEKWEEVRE